ncbi:hypothetical protein HDU99_005676, partial [Rhizoclosmatium hyalinum]
LAGCIPSKIGNLICLESLCLGRNELEGQIPRELGKLSKLRDLMLDGNRLSGIIPAELEGLEELEQVLLGGNEFDSVPSLFNVLPNLKKWNISNLRALLLKSLPSTVTVIDTLIGYSSLPLLRQAIKTCDFIAVDTELSGLHRVASEGPHGSDTAQVRYEKLKASSQAFAILQFGVATFTWDSTIKKYVVRSFNFPVFPQAGKQILGLDRRFLVESSAVDFLLSTGFNFDNTFKTGIPYVRFDEEEIAKANIDKIENASNSNVIPLDHTNRDFVETA